MTTHKGLIFPILMQDWMNSNKSQQHMEISILPRWKAQLMTLQNKPQDPIVLIRYPLTTAFTRHNKTLQSKNIHEFWLSQCMQSAENHTGSSASLAAANKSSQVRRTHRSGFPPQLCHLVRKSLPSNFSGFCLQKWLSAGSFKEKWEL